MIRMLKKVALVIYTFLFLFNPTVFVQFNFLYVLVAISAIYFFFNVSKCSVVLRSKYVLVYCLFICYLVIYLFFLGAMGGVEAFYMAYNYMLVLASVSCAVFIVMNYMTIYPASFNGFLSFLISVGIAQIFFVLATLLVPELRDWVLASSRSEDLVSISNDYGGLRSYGIANGYTATFPMLMGLYALILYSLAAKNALVGSKSVIYLTLMFFFLISIVLNARIGLVPVLVFFVFSSLAVVLKRTHLVLQLKLGLILLVGLPLILYFASDVEQYTVRLIWALDEVTALVKGQAVGTFDVLHSMLFFPDNIAVFLLGEGRNVFEISDDFRKYSDIGFVRDIYMFGFFNLVLLTFAVYYFSGPLRSLLNKELGMLVVFVFYVSLVVFYAKGAIWSSTEVYNFFVLLCMFSIAYKLLFESRDESSYS